MKREKEHPMTHPVRTHSTLGRGQNAGRSARNRAARRARGGFTLVEVLLVVAILGILAGIVVVSTKNRVPKTQIAATRMSIQGIQTAIDTYEVDNGKMPSSLQALITQSGELNWNGPYVQNGRLPADPWGNQFQYTLKDNNAYELRSAGPDGQMGTSDDITN
jgi:general secretion pathway protein G